MNLKGKRLENLPLINMLSEDQEPYTYSSLLLGLQNKQAYGIFFDNTFRTFFDFVMKEEMLQFL
jgi:alpha-glucosidase